MKTRVPERQRRWAIALGGALVCAWPAVAGAARSEGPQRAEIEAPGATCFSVPAARQQLKRLWPELNLLEVVGRSGDPDPSTLAIVVRETGGSFEYDVQHMGRRVHYVHGTNPQCQAEIRARIVAVSSFVFVQSLAADRAARSRGGRKVSWEQAFSDEVKSYLPAERLRVLVAVVRGEDDTAESSARALTKALRDSGRCELVIDDASIRPVDGISDAEIVRRAGALPITTVAVVRSAGGGKVLPSDVRPMATVTLYSVGGKALTALSLSAGATLAKRDDLLEAQSLAAARMLQETEPRRLRADAWERDFLDFSAAHKVGGMAVAYRGRQREPLGGASLFSFAGRADLARASTRNEAIRRGTLVGGEVLAVGGFLGLIGSWAFADTDEQAKSGMIGSAVVMLVGLGATLGVAFVRFPPDSGSTVGEVVAEHNRALRERLGLPPLQEATGVEPKPARAASPQPPVVGLAPLYFHGGGGLGLAGSF